MASSWRLTAITFTNVVFPEYWRPTSVSSISSFQNRVLNQSSSRFTRASIFRSVSTLPHGSVCLSLPVRCGVFQRGREVERRQLSYDQSAENAPTAPLQADEGNTPIACNVVFYPLKCMALLYGVRLGPHEEKNVGMWKKIFLMYCSKKKVQIPTFFSEQKNP